MRVLVAAVLTYIAICLYMGLSLPGLQYDEAIYEHGAVALITADHTLPFAREDRAWVPIGERLFPLMVISYAGAAKFYLLIVPFSLFGTTALVGRAVSMVLGAIGIFGIGRFVQLHVGHWTGAAVAFVLALHPEYIGWTIYDNAGNALWMANCGFIALAANFFLKKPTRVSACVLGFAIGFAIWGRANFLWMIGGLAIAVFVVFPDFVFARRRSLPPLIAGSIVGASPLLAFELATRFSTLHVPPAVRLADVFRSRIGFAASALAYDYERAAMWGGQPAPEWLTFAFGMLVIVLIAVSFAVRQRDRAVLAARCAGIATIVSFACAFMTRLNVNPHHFAAMLPLPVIAVVSMAACLARVSRMTRAAVALVAVAYVACAVTWNRAAHVGLLKTRGVGMWSNAVSTVETVLTARANGRTVQIVDWGLANNLYVLSGGRLSFREVFWHADDRVASGGVPWPEVVRTGGLFLANAPENTSFVAPSRGFRAALAQSRAHYTVVAIRQTSGAGYAYLYDVQAAR